MKISRMSISCRKPILVTQYAKYCEDRFNKPYRRARTVVLALDLLVNMSCVRRRSERSWVPTLTIVYSWCFCLGNHEIYLASKTISNRTIIQHGVCRLAVPDTRQTAGMRCWSFLPFVLVRVHIITFLILRPCRCRIQEPGPNPKCSTTMAGPTELWRYQVFKAFRSMDLQPHPTIVRPH